MKKIVFFLILLAPWLTIASDQDPRFDSATSILTIPQVQVGNSFVYDAKLKFTGNNNFVLQNFANTAPPQCTITGDNLNTCRNFPEPNCDSPITLDKVNKIKPGMGRGEVTKIMGCVGTQWILFPNTLSWLWKSKGTGENLIAFFTYGNNPAESDKLLGWAY